LASLAENLPGAQDFAVQGIDVSHFQQTVAWPAVARSGIRFCFIKATEGAARVDSQFDKNWQGAAQAGLIRGAYHFFHPVLSAEEQATSFLNTVQQLQPGDLPPVLDLEAPNEWTPIPAAARATLAATWLEAVEKGLGATPIIYVSPAFASGVLRSAPALARYPVWLAHYTSAPAPLIPKPWKTWAFWQYTSRGKAPGVATPVDLDRFNGSMEDLKALTIPPPPATP
jgi:lysozyme